MIKVVGINFEDSKKIYYFSPNGFEIKINDKVIVETERGEQFGYVVTDENFKVLKKDESNDNFLQIIQDLPYVNYVEELN